MPLVFQVTEPELGLAQRALKAVVAFFQTPSAQYPLLEIFALVLAVLWLFKRREDRVRHLDQEALDILEARFRRGEIDQEAYERIRKKLRANIRR